MNKKNIIKGLGVLVALGGLASCSSDYLDLKPEAQVSQSEVSQNSTAMRLVIYGLCESMYTQYSALYDFRWFNGEPWLSMVYGDVNGQDYISLFWQSSLPSVANWESINRDNYTANVIPWTYGYNLINPANICIGVDTPDNDNISGELAFRIAQAYTFRAHAYIRLHQIYGPAWDYSNNGESTSVILRTEPTNANTDPNKGLSTTNEVLDLIYSDLNRALELYDLSEYSRDYVWEPDKSVALGIFARAALLKNDWETAYEMAKQAHDGYDIMSREDYVSGFAAPTSESMWSSVDTSTGIYYASFGATYACNGAYPCIWGSVGAGAIDLTFFNKVNNANDIRCSLYFTPDKVSRAMRAQFWNENNCDANTLDVNIGPDLSPLVQDFAMQKYAEIGQPSGYPAPFNALYQEMNNEIDMEGESIQFGAQFKFWGTDIYSASSFPFMRASEMYLVEAEAACHLGKYAEAQQALKAVNENRILNYTASSKTGDDLLEEVKLQRRLELWGEGFSWFDFKRWNQDIVRNIWIAGNTNSGNWPTAISGASTKDATYGELKAGEYNGWKWAIPQSESQYNDAISKSNSTAM